MVMTKQPSRHFYTTQRYCFSHKQPKNTSQNTHKTLDTSLITHQNDTSCPPYNDYIHKHGTKFELFIKRYTRKNNHQGTSSSKTSWFAHHIPTHKPESVQTVTYFALHTAFSVTKTTQNILFSLLNVIFCTPRTLSPCSYVTLYTHNVTISPPAGNLSPTLTTPFSHQMT